MAYSETDSDSEFNNKFNEVFKDVLNNKFISNLINNRNHGIDTCTDAHENSHAKPSIAAAIKAVVKAYAQNKSCNTCSADMNTGIMAEELINNLIHGKLPGKIRCRHCSNSDVILYGNARGKQRYMCKKCGRTFSALSNTLLNGTHHPEKWGIFMECMLQGLSLQASAENVKVSYVTLFYWRHKILSILKDIKPKEMKGIIELDDIYLNYSQKGQKKSFSVRDIFEKDPRVHRRSDNPYNFQGDKVCVIAAADRFSNVFSTAACIGHPRGEDVEKAVGMLISDKSTICFNHKAAYTTFLNKRHLKRCRASLYGIKFAKLYIRKCMKWIHRFMGVATSYLNNYLGWYKFLHDINFDETLDGIKRLMKVINVYN